MPYGSNRKSQDRMGRSRFTLPFTPSLCGTTLQVPFHPDPCKLRAALSSSVLYIYFCCSSHTHDTSATPSSLRHTPMLFGFFGTNSDKQDLRTRQPAPNGTPVGTSLFVVSAGGTPTRTSARLAARRNRRAVQGANTGTSAPANRQQMSRSAAQPGSSVSAPQSGSPPPVAHLEGSTREAAIRVFQNTVGHSKDKAFKDLRKTASSIGYAFAVDAMEKQRQSQPTLHMSTLFIQDPNANVAMVRTYNQAVASGYVEARRPCNTRR